MRKLQDRIAVVTGAASGIGRATSLALAQQGCDLALSDVDPAGLEQTAAAVQALGRRACTHQVDVSDRAAMERYAQEVMATYGEVHILINNAGVTAMATFEDQTLDDFEWVIGVNLMGVIYGCKAFLPYLKQAEEAHIVNISSVFGLMGFPTQAAYCTSKFGVRGFSEALWVELREHGIGGTSVHPAGVRTQIAKAARTVSDEDKSFAIDLIERAGVPPEHAASKIVAAIRRGKMRQLIAKEALFIDWWKRWIPQPTQRVLQYGFVRSRPHRGGS